MSQVFNYFFVAGAGLALGIACVTIPAIAYYPRIANRLQMGIRRGKRS